MGRKPTNWACSKNFGLAQMAKAAPKPKPKRINSRSKGKAGELEFAGLLKSRGVNARRGQQYAGGTNSPDVISDYDDVHFEVKRTESGNLYKWMKQAERDAPNKLKVVAHRKNNEEWVAIVPMKDFLDLLMLREASRI